MLFAAVLEDMWFVFPLQTVLLYGRACRCVFGVGVRTYCSEERKKKTIQASGVLWLSDSLRVVPPYVVMVCLAFA